MLQEFILVLKLINESFKFYNIIYLFKYQKIMKGNTYILKRIYLERNAERDYQ